MTRDYKDSAPSSGAAAKTNTLLLGIVVGLVLGLTIALGVAWYINKMPSPFKHLQIPEPPATTSTPTPAAPTTTTTQQQHFDFYKILPGNNDTTGTPVSPTPSALSKPKPASNNTATTAAPAAGIYYLQIAALQNPADADGLKGKLALLGIQASVQTVTTPDKGTLYRVRTGPYATPAELDTARATLNQNNYAPTLVKGQ